MWTARSHTRTTSQLSAKNINALSKTFADIETVAGEFGLKNNEDKLKYIKI